MSQVRRFELQEIHDGAVVVERNTEDYHRGREKNSVDNDAGKEIKVTHDGSKEGAKVLTWGKDNKLPQRREALIKSNNIVASLIKTRRDITLGNGLTMFTVAWEEEDGKLKRKLYEVPIPDKIQEWLENSHIKNYLRVACKNLFFHANTFTEMIPSKDGSEITSIECKEARHVRAEVQDNDGIIQNYFHSMNWNPKAGSNKRAQDLVRIPGYHPLYHNKLPRQKFMYHTGDELLTDDYYFEPDWWGGREWIMAANAVPKFHNANFRNGYTIRWHIQYPNDYFDDVNITLNTEKDREKALQKKKEKRKEFMRIVNELLAGIENAGRALFTSYDLDKALNKEFSGIKITPLKGDLQDEALLKLYEKSNQAVISGQGIHPTLANIETQGKLSSGSEIRNAFLMYLAIKTPAPRDILLEPLNIVKNVNGWDKDLIFGFRDIEITRLDENKEGKQEVAAE